MSVAIIGLNLRSTQPLVDVVSGRSALKMDDLLDLANRAASSRPEHAADELPAEALLNVNTPEDRRGPGPVARLTRSLTWLAPAERAQVVAGERRRLAAHGMVDLRYPPSPRRAEDG